LLRALFCFQEPGQACIRRGLAAAGAWRRPRPARPGVLDAPVRVAPLWDARDATLLAGGA
jgi:hypothetical protein